LKLNQVTVAVNAIEPAVAFYRGMGLRLIVLSPHYARFECPVGDATFSLHQAPGSVPQHTTVIYFECDDLDDRVARLREQGYEFTQLPRDERWLWREARIKDPSGNEICLYFAGENRKNPPWRLQDTLINESCED
jgi:catechol 2,3-dioxygenase-like lactoylglutathione lyase family enzyme